MESFTESNLSLVFKSKQKVIVTGDITDIDGFLVLLNI